MSAQGRPTTYTPELADRICARLIDGESLRGICRDPDMPAAGTVFRWIASSNENYKGFQEQYTRAREAQADVFVDEIIEISDDATNDWMERENEDGQNIGWAVNGEHIQRSRLRVDSRKWFASKVLPKKYGDRSPDAAAVGVAVTFVLEGAAPKVIDAVARPMLEVEGE